ncbi:hypothetical protein ACPXB3_14885 [Gordonia sp. DT219]|uniref:hypothetical protein n=1 Tax=Gordonia sp. DT219 TaxID=3416658 RepID=UPI003CEC5BFF
MGFFRHTRTPANVHESSTTGVKTGVKNSYPRRTKLITTIPAAFAGSFVTVDEDGSILTTNNADDGLTPTTARLFAEELRAAAQFADAIGSISPSTVENGE